MIFRVTVTEMLQNKPASSLISKFKKLKIDNSVKLDAQQFSTNACVYDFLKKDNRNFHHYKNNQV